MNPKRDKRIKRKSQQRANKTFRRQIQSRKQDVKRIRRQGRREQEDTANAADFLRNGLNDALGSIDPALKGRYAKQVQNELGAMLKDVGQMEGMFRKDTRRAVNTDLRTAQTALADSRLQRTLEAKDLYRTKVGEVKTAQADRAKQASLIQQEAQRLLTQYGPQNTPQTKAQWAKFADTVADAEGINDPFMVAKLIDALRKQMAGPSGIIGRAAATAVTPPTEAPDSWIDRFGAP